MFDVFDEIYLRIDHDLAVSEKNLMKGDYGTLVVIVSMALNLLVYLGFLISIVAIAFSFIKYILSEGDPERTKEAWSAFILGVIAAAISLGAVALKVIIMKIIGVETTGISVLESGGY